MRVTEPLTDNLAYVEVAEFGLHVLAQEQVRTFHISVKDTTQVETSQAPNNLDEDIPDLLLLNVGLPLLIVADFLEDVSVVRILHDQTQARSRLINEGITVGNDVRVLDRGEDSDFIEGILLFFLREREHFDVLQCICFGVVLAPDLED